MSVAPGTVSLAAVSSALQAWLTEAGIPLVLRDRATGEWLPVPIEIAGDPNGLLPVFLVAGEAVWREATGKGFALAVRRDPGALLGYRLDSIGSGSFSAVLLSTMEATAQVARNDQLPVHDLFGAVWKATLDRADRTLSGRAVAAIPVSQSEANP